MFKLYCLSYHHRVRWSFSGKFHNYSDLIKWLHNMKFVSFWGDDNKYYKIVSPEGDIDYIVVSPGRSNKRNYLWNVTLNYICKATNFYESLLL